VEIVGHLWAQRKIFGRSARSLGAAQDLWAQREVSGRPTRGFLGDLWAQSEIIGLNARLLGFTQWSGQTNDEENGGLN
jgi:hypothetical protein